MNAGVVLAVVLGAVAVLTAVVVATTVVLRAQRDTTAELSNQARTQSDVMRLQLAGDIGHVEDVAMLLNRSVSQLADLQPTLADLVARLAEPSASGASSGPTEITDSRIVAELNHALQTPLRGLGYAVRNLANLPDEVLLQERARRLADMTAMLDSATSALATFRGLVDTIASVPTRQPSLDEAVRAFGASIPRPPGEPVVVDMAGLPDQVAGFSNHYLLTMLQPLVENAIEGCSPGGTVELTFADHGDAVEFTVANPVDRPVDRDVLFAPHSTTKNGHQGLGVSIVSRLAEFVRGDLIADVTDTDVRMRVLLPRR